MAFLCNARNARINNCTCFLLHLLKRRMKSISVEVDALDVFTTQLVHEKAYKWDIMKLKNNVTTSSKKMNKHEVEDTITAQALGDMLREGIDENDVEKIMTILKKCKEHKIIHFSLIINVLSYFAQNGHIDGIKYIQEIYKEINPTALYLHAHFEQYLAHAIWIKGNIPKALSIFTELYRDNQFLRPNIRLLLRYLFYKAAQQNSEAIMITISRFTEDLVKELKDFTPMVNLWRICFLSEWYSDQVLAADLLDRNKELLKVLLPEVPHTVASALKYHKIEPIYKLLEILLKYDCKTDCSLVLLALFDYKFRQRDFYSCSQILQWSTKYNVLLPALQQKKVLQLLLNMKDQPTKPVKLERKNYNLQF